MFSRFFFVRKGIKNYCKRNTKLRMFIRVSRRYQVSDTKTFQCQNLADPNMAMLGSHNTCCKNLQNPFPQPIHLRKKPKQL